jgi:hypothetical protein
MSSFVLFFYNFVLLFIFQEEQKRLRRRSQDVLENVKKRRSCELFDKWKHQREEIEKQAQQTSKIVDESFKAQGMFN